MFIPAASKLVAGDCLPGAPCEDVLEVELKEPPSQGREMKLSFQAGGEPFSLSFRERAGVTRYAIALDRVWFWTPGARLLPPEGSLRLRLGRRPAGEEVLY
jgi:hypothetical protein